MDESSEGRALFAKVAATREAARPLNNRVLEFAMAENDDEAKKVLFAEASPATQKLQDAIDEAIAFQKANNKASLETAETDYQHAQLLLIIANAVNVFMAVALGWLVTRSITSQLGGEPGEASALAQAVAGGDLTVKVELRGGDTTSMMAHLKEMQESLVKVVSNVRTGAEGVSNASAEIASGNNDLSARTEAQASSLEETAASMEELSATVKQNADIARQANQLALNASSVAAKGGDVVGQVVNTMKDINDSSRKIADIISVIDGIAFQTNILALNAAVEAARAGEQGRGFAVVASEVRTLAGRSADAAKEIKTLINSSVERVEQGTAQVDEAGVTMSEVVSSIKRVTDLMGDISAASNEQAAGVAQVGEAVVQMDQVTQQNAALVEEMAAAASSLKSQAQELVQVVAVFKLGADNGQHDMRRGASLQSYQPVSRPLAVKAQAPARPKAIAAPLKQLASKPATAPQKAAKAATPAGGDDDWETF
jgi:methyl-accepting chemotaxis protein